MGLRLWFSVVLVTQVFTLGLLTTIVQAEPVIESMAFEREGGAASLVIGTGEEIGFDAFTLSNPRRLVIDFAEGNFGNAFAAPRGIDARYGFFQPDRPRLVIDLGRPLGISQAYIGDRRDGPAIIVELQPVSEEAFEEASGWPDEAIWTPQPSTPPAPDGRIVVVLDPGHGGIDPGASVDGLVEKEIVLRIGRQIAEAIGETKEFRPILTRDDDSYVPLRERVRIAQRAGANVLISLHADTLENGKATGLSAYTLSEKGTDQAADAFAERENRADVLAGADLVGETDQMTRLLLDLSQRATAPESDRLAEAILASVSKKFKLLRTRPHRQAAFVVLKSPNIPSVLIELGFLSSAEDRKRLQSDEYGKAIAEALVEGLELWRDNADPAFTAPRR